MRNTGTEGGCMYILKAFLLIGLLFWLLGVVEMGFLAGWAWEGFRYCWTTGSNMSYRF